MSARPQTAPRAMASSSDGASIVVADSVDGIVAGTSATAVVLASRAREKRRHHAQFRRARGSVHLRRRARALSSRRTDGRIRELRRARRVVAQGAQASRTARRRVRVRGRDCAKATVRRLERARAAGPIGEARTVEFASGGGDRARVGVE